MNIKSIIGSYPCIYKNAF